MLRLTYKANLVMSLFPHLRRARVELVLRDLGGDPEKAINFFLSEPPEDEHPNVLGSLA